MSLHAFAKEIREITNSKFRFVYKVLPQDDPRVRKPDISRAIQYLKWCPEIGLNEGLIKTIKWFKKNKRVK